MDEVSEARQREIIERWHAGMSAAAIASAMGLHANTVMNHIARYLDNNETENKADKARAMFLAGATIMDVVRECEISSHRAKAIRAGINFDEDRPSDDATAVSVWRLHMRGIPPSQIDTALGIFNAKEIVVYEWRLDRLGQPSMLRSKS